MKKTERKPNFEQTSDWCFYRVDTLEIVETFKLREEFFWSPPDDRYYVDHQHYIPVWRKDVDDVLPGETDKT